MTKTVFLPLGLIFILAAATPSTAQTSATDDATRQAVLRQGERVTLDEKLVNAQNAFQAGQISEAARLYQESAELALQIGSGIDKESGLALAGLAKTRLMLARQAQESRHFDEAAKQINLVLKYDAKNSEAQALKRTNDQYIEAFQGKMPDTETIHNLDVVREHNIQADTLVQNGKLFYEMGKLDEAETNLNEAAKLNKDNTAAFYYLQLVQQERIHRVTYAHAAETQERMQNVEKEWIASKSGFDLPHPNAYALTNLIYTGSGRTKIENKLNRIRLVSVTYDQLPLSEVLLRLAKQAKDQDVWDRTGVNFMINPNPNLSDAAPTAANAPAAQAGFPGRGNQPQTARLDPNTGIQLPTEDLTAATAGDVGGFLVTLNLTDVSLAEVLDALVVVAKPPPEMQPDNQVKFSIVDYGVIFSSKSKNTEPMFDRTYRVDMSTFIQGLEGVTSLPFSTGNTSSGGGGTFGGGGGGGGSSGQSGGTSIPTVDFTAGASQIRASFNQSGGGGGGGGNFSQGNGGNGATGAGGALAGGGGGGVNFITKKSVTQSLSQLVVDYFTALGIHLNTAGKTVFFNDRLGLLTVRATQDDLDAIERAIDVLNQLPPMVHIKARFIEVDQSDNKALGFDWYMGQIGNTVALTGGTSPSLAVPVSASNPQGYFPGGAGALTAAATTDQLVTGGLANSGPVVATVTGIMTNPNFQAAIHALQTRSGSEILGEPEVTTISGRQTQMRATTLQYIILGESGGSTLTGTGGGGGGGGFGGGGGGGGAGVP